MPTKKIYTTPALTEAYTGLHTMHNSRWTRLRDRIINHYSQYRELASVLLDRGMPRGVTSSNIPNIFDYTYEDGLPVYNPDDSGWPETMLFERNPDRTIYVSDEIGTLITVGYTNIEQQEYTKGVTYYNYAPFYEGDTTKYFLDQIYKIECFRAIEELEGKHFKPR